MKRVGVTPSLSLLTISLGGSSRLISPTAPGLEPRVFGPKPVGNTALNPLDQPVDELGAHVQTEGDAKAYVEALVKRWGPQEAGPHLPEFEGRLARAEYLAVRNPDKLIPESQVATTFNRLMDEWRMPEWTSISAPKLHEFRLPYATIIYPNSVARLPDQSIAPGCRPAEALFLLYLLNSKGGIPPELREQVASGRRAAGDLASRWE